jgi:hypothetical protein
MDASPEPDQFRQNQLSAGFNTSMGEYRTQKLNMTELKQSKKFLVNRHLMQSALDHTRSKRMMLNTSPGKNRDTEVLVGKQSLVFGDD